LEEIQPASERISKAISRQESILVWGDFDVDGQTSTTILISTLEHLGAKVDYHVPVRAMESHGIRPEVLNSYLENGTNLVITCDTGISAIEAINLANAKSVDVIITDHHQLPEKLPSAKHIINPNFGQRIILAFTFWSGCGIHSCQGFIGE